MSLIESIKSAAKGKDKTIVLPEGEAERTLYAADIILAEDIAKLILVGDKDIINANSRNLNLKNIDKAEIYDANTDSRDSELVELLYKLRHTKGLSKAGAREFCKNPLYIGPLLIKLGYADGEVAGAENSTGDVLRPAFQIVKTAPNSSVVSGAFIMVLKDKNYGQDGLMVFADCAVNPNPNAKQLAEIAVASARTAKAIAKMDPKVAMLSFSTKGSGSHDDVNKVTEATKIARIMAPEIQIDGELQADAAIVEAIGRSKAPDSYIAGKANVLVFPNLDAGNISYKLVQRLAGAEAIGPVLQGMAAPINDLSRGCSVNDIVNLVAITANQAK